MKKALIALATLFTGFLSSQNTLSEKETNFVKMSEDHTLLEIKLAQLAQTNASSMEVKNLASALLSDHTKASGELQQLAAKKNISLPSQLSDKSQKYYDKMSLKQGAEFDKSYTKCVVKSHKMGACYLKKESKKAKDGEVKAWAAAEYPVLEQDSEKAKATCKTIKKA